MTELLTRRIEAEWAQAHLISNPGFMSGESKGNEGNMIRPAIDSFRDRVNSISTIRDDLAYLNREIDVYK